MWNPFLKKSTAQPSKSPENKANRVDELANALQQKGRIRDLEQELMKLDQSSLSPAEHESWWHLYGIVAFQEGRDTEALERFEEAHRRFPHSAQIRFSLGQQYIRAKSIEKGFELFRTCKFPEVSREYALAQARYAYLWNRYSDGLLFIRPFFDAYKQVNILDDHFLYVRGLPFFGRWWAYLAAFAILSGELEELESITRFVVQNCHDYDFDYLKAELKAYRDDAVIKARMATTIEAAQEILASVVLSEQDFPWLEDIRMLALAEAAHRLADPALERESVEAFLVRQPMLFEPDIALNFHLLRYQENLKPRVASR
jgi:tetratricopeptide (TPR) repeat protein